MSSSSFSKHAKNFFLGYPSEGKPEKTKTSSTTSGARPRTASYSEGSPTEEPTLDTAPSNVKVVPSKPLPVPPEEENERNRISKPQPPERKKSDTNVAPRPHQQTEYRWPEDGNEIRSMLRGLTQRDNQLFDLNADYKELEKEKQMFEQENKDLTDQLRVIQESSFRPTQQGPWKPMDESAVTMELESLQNAIDEFGREHAADSLVLPNDNVVGATKEIRSALQEVWRLPGDIKEMESEFRNVRRGVRLALTGLISSTICKEIMSNPFFFVDEDLLLALESAQTRSDLPQRLSPRSLFQLYVVFQHVDARKAHVWRSDFMRLLSPPVSETNDASESVRHASREARDAACLRTARCLLTGAMHLLVKPLQSPIDPKLKELEGLCRKAASLAGRLWTQRTAMECVALQGLARLTYNNELTIMRAHRMHQIDDPNDHTHDGRRVQIVVHPAVLARGTFDGEGYASTRVWAKAVVWLDERGEVA